MQFLQKLWKMWENIEILNLSQQKKEETICCQNQIAYIKTDDIYKEISEDVETRFGTWNYDLDRSLPKGKDKKVIGLIRKFKLDGKITTKFVRLRAKTYSYLIDDGSEDKKVKGTKNCAMKRKLKFQDHKNCLEATQLQNKMNRLEKN